jgi:hypothetical protein
MERQSHGSLIITSASYSFNDNAEIKSESNQNIEKARYRIRAIPSGGGGAFHSQGCDLFSGFDAQLAFNISFCVNVFSFKSLCDERSSYVMF